MKFPPVCLVLFLLGIQLTGFSQDSPKAAVSGKLSLTNLKSVPPGNYLVTLEVDGQRKRFNLLVEANKGKVVNSSDPDLNNVEATFESFDDKGRFVARLQGSRFRATQLWIFKTDGAAAIREAPDRGETQSAVPVKGDALEPDAQLLQKPMERRAGTARMILCGPFGMDFGDDRVLVGFYRNVFIARVLEEQGPAPLDPQAFLPYTRFLVEVLENIKGDLKGRVHVDQVGGMKNGVKHEVAVDGGGTAPQLIPGKTYVMATLGDEKDLTIGLKLDSRPGAYTLLDEVPNEIPDVTAFSKHPKVVKLKAAALNPIESPFK